MRSENRSPWNAWLRAALALGLAPQAFWRLSVREWRALAGDASVLAREDLALLMRRFPDES